MVSNFKAILLKFLLNKSIKLVKKKTKELFHLIETHLLKKMFKIHLDKLYLHTQFNCEKYFKTHIEIKAKK